MIIEVNHIDDIFINDKGYTIEVHLRNPTITVTEDSENEFNDCSNVHQLINKAYQLGIYDELEEEVSSECDDEHLDTVDADTLLCELCSRFRSEDDFLNFLQEEGYNVTK